MGNVLKRSYVLGLLVVLANPSTTHATITPIVYPKKAIGSDASFNPVSYYFNLAFDTTQNPFYFTQSGYFRSHGSLWNRIKHPFGAIRDEGGFGKFLGSEFFGLRSIPNWTLHLIGGGHDFRWLAEWYQARSVPYPYVAAFLTSYLANIGNEAIETTASQVPPTDHIADLFFFDLVGKFLFMNDAIARFFYETMQLRAWHYQPMFNLNDQHIINAGANYILRPRLFGKKILPFFHAGLALLAGVSFTIEGENWFTTAAGVSPTDPLKFKGDFILGFYWDRNDALLASLTLNGSSNLAVRLNIYPQVVRIREWDIGLFAAYGKDNTFALGVNINMPLGISGTLNF